MFEFFIAILASIMVSARSFWLLLGISNPNDTLVDLLIITFFIIAYFMWRKRRNREK